jgi:hypothetical protein
MSKPIVLIGVRYICDKTLILAERDAYSFYTNKFYVILTNNGYLDTIGDGDIWITHVIHV